MSYTIELSHDATKVLDRLDKQTERRLRDRFKELSLNPINPRISKPLKTMSGVRSSRVGDWRIIYTVPENDRILSVLSIDPRGRAYK